MDCSWHKMMSSWVLTLQCRSPPGLGKRPPEACLHGCLGHRTGRLSRAQQCRLFPCLLCLAQSLAKHQGMKKCRRVREPGKWADPSHCADVNDTHRSAHYVSSKPRELSQIPVPLAPSRSPRSRARGLGSSKHRLIEMLSKHGLPVTHGTEIQSQSKKMLRARREPWGQTHNLGTCPDGESNP